VTTILEATTIITTQFNSNYSTTTVRWPNVAFEEPEDGTPWVSFNISIADAIIQTISVKHNDQLGMVLINVFTKARTGMIANNTLVQEVRAIFNRLTITGIHFEAPEIRQVTTNSDDIWFNQLVRIPFVYNEALS